MLTETLTIATCGISNILSVFIDSAAESRKKKLTAYLQKTPKHSRVTNSPKQRKPETDMQTQQQKPNSISEFKPNIAFTHRLYSSFMQCMYCSICWILRSVEIQGNKQQVVQDSTGVTSQVLSGSHTLLVLIGFQKKMSVTHPIFTHITSSPLKVPWSCYLPCTWAMSDQRVWQLGECKQTTPFIGGSLKVKLSTIWRDEKQSREVDSEERTQFCAKVSRKEIQFREMLGKPRMAVFFPWFVVPAGGKVGSLKRCEPCRHRRNENLPPLWREAHLQVKTYKTHHLRATFWSSAPLKWHAAVAQSTFASQNIQNTSAFLSIGPLLGVQLWKNGTPLWREAHLQVKVLKNMGFGALFEVRLSKNYTLLWREAHLQLKMHKTPAFRTTFWVFDIAKVSDRRNK